jgi:lipopolysaccharide/colanic/teichoic acid biosynthesis glycosyltransferase
MDRMSVQPDPHSQSTNKIFSRKILPGRLTQFALLLVAVLSGVVLWHRIDAFRESRHSLDALVLITTGIVFSMTAALGLCRGVRKVDTWVYRLALLGGVLLITFRWVIVWRLAKGASPPFYLYILLALSIFIGCWIASGFQYGLVENTFPPSEDVTLEVKRKYLTHTQNPPTMPWTKRLFDLALSLLGIILSSPLWIGISILLWLQDPGPIFFIKNCVGYQGDNFRLLKFRTMRLGAEVDTGPIASNQQDQRVHLIGHLLRKTALDELPQLLNILGGEMSFVGPRPLRTVVEVEYLKEIPGYAARYDVLPGLSGLAQIAGDYYLPSRDKLRYERIYAEHVSLGFDIKLIVLAFLLVFWLRWKKDWNGRVPRAWIRWTPGSNKRTGRID